MAQRYWGLDEFRLALEAAGFGAVRVTGNYDRSRTLIRRPQPDLRGHSARLMARGLGAA